MCVNFGLLFCFGGNTTRSSSVRPPFPKRLADSSLEIPHTQESECDIYPNPVSDTMTVTFSLEKPSEVEISLFDNLGRKILSSGLPSLSEGKQVFEIDTRDIPEGLYYCKINSINNTDLSIAKQVIIIH